MHQSKYVIVVGVDYSTASERALNEAFAVGCNKRGVQLHVVNVRPASGQPVAVDGPLEGLPPWRYWAAELREFVARQVAAFQANARETPFQHLYTQQRMGDPARELRQFASDVGADLLIVGAHDWHGTSDRPLGSVAQALTQLAPCPVQLVHREPAQEPARNAAGSGANTIDLTSTNSRLRT